MSSKCLLLWQVEQPPSSQPWIPAKWASFRQDQEHDLSTLHPPGNALPEERAWGARYPLLRITLNQKKISKKEKGIIRQRKTKTDRPPREESDLEIDNDAPQETRDGNSEITEMMDQANEKGARRGHWSPRWWWAEEKPLTCSQTDAIKLNPRLAESQCLRQITGAECLHLTPPQDAEINPDSTQSY